MNETVINEAVDNAAVCAELLEMLNTMITYCARLGDNYYLNALNPSTYGERAAKGLGINFGELMEKLELYRAILFGVDGLDWDYVLRKFKESVP
mgnify:CR=1 FL=1